MVLEVLGRAGAALPGMEDWKAIAQGNSLTLRGKLNHEALSYVLGLFNTILRPVLVLLTLPVTLLTLGLFLFVINALLFWATASVLDGFTVAGFGAALIGSLIYSLCGMAIDVLIERLFPDSE